jgi:non-specific serine/threonine protein kinase
VAVKEKRRGSRTRGGIARTAFGGAAPISSPKAPLNNLVAQADRFIGRQAEKDQVAMLLEEARLLTLTGPGGIGKTRLALQVASETVDRFPDGTWMVDLGRISDPGLVPYAVASLVGVAEDAVRPMLETLAERISNQRMLIVLDTCEHLIDSCAGLAAALLKRGRAIKLLATSREPLNIPGEAVWLVSSLSLPRPNGSADTTDVRASEAVELFVERAQRRRPGLALDDTTAQEIAQICIALDGIPLAIELAAALAGTLALEDILKLQRKRFPMIADLSRVATFRQRTLRATIDWSHNLLTVREQALFRRLAVFAGSFDLDAVEAVCGESDVDAAVTLHDLLRLVDKSMVVADVGATTTRFRLLDTLHRYAEERLKASDEMSITREKHAAHYLAHAERLNTLHPTLATVVEQLAVEDANLRAAMEWCIADSERLARFVVHVFYYWVNRGLLSQGRPWIQLALDGYHADDLLRARLLNAAAMSARLRDDQQEAARAWQEALDLSRRIEDRVLEGRILMNLTLIAADQEDWAWSRSVAEQGLSIARESGDDHHVATSLSNLGFVLMATGDLDAAHAACQEGLALLEKLDYSLGIPPALDNLGAIATDQGDLQAASAYYTRGMEAALKLGDQRHVAMMLEGMAVLAAARRDFVTTLKLAAAAESIRKAIGTPLKGFLSGRLERAIAAARARVPSGVAGSAWRRGAAMPLADAAGLALSKLGDVSESGPGGPRRRSLEISPREQQVATMITQGMTNAAIAHDLHLAVRTVDAHVEHIRNKLGVHSRAEIAAWAVSRGWSEPG